MYHKLYLRDVPANAIHIKPKTVQIPLKNGKFETRSLNDKGKMIVHSEYWYAKVKQPDGNWKEMVLAKGKQNATHKLCNIEKEMEDIRCGRKVPVREDKPLNDLIKQWISSKEGKGCHKAYVHVANTDLRMVLDKLNVKEVKDFLNPAFEQHFQNVADAWLVDGRYKITVPEIEEFTLDQIAALLGSSLEHANTMTKANAIPYTERDGRKRFKRENVEALMHSRNKPASRGTINRWTGMVKDFVNYLIRQKVMSLTHKPNMPAKLEDRIIDRRKVRRAVTWQECLQLCESVIAVNAQHKYLNAFERSVLYRTAFCTLLRRRALQELKVSDCHLNAKTPFISVRKETDKTGRARSIPIMNKQLLDDLKTLIQDKPLGHKVWDCPNNTADFLRRDIKDANLEFRTVEGDWDFHAFRHSGATHMALNNVPLYQVCKLGGWANFEMFFNRYGHLSIEDLGKSVEGVF
jgi:integrase